MRQCSSALGLSFVNCDKTDSTSCCPQLPQQQSFQSSAVCTAGCSTHLMPRMRGHVRGLRQLQDVLEHHQVRLAPRRVHQLVLGQPLLVLLVAGVSEEKSLIKTTFIARLYRPLWFFYGPSCHVSFVTVLLEVATGVYYSPGLDGSCSSAHQPKGKSESKLSFST